MEFFEEGGVKIAKNEDTFFNPAQELNRDISIEILKKYFDGRETVKICSAMAATGLREIRYLKEMANSRLFLNDISPSAIETLKKNLAMNGFENYKEWDDSDNLRISRERINITKGDCSVLMSRYHGMFDAIDIDPFGSCAPFVGDAIKAVKHNGLLMLTCTDKAALCSNEKKCYTRYGIRIIRNYSKNETPVRALLSFIAREASKYNASIVPILCLSVDFYVRVFVRVKKSNGRGVLTDTSHALICDCLNSHIFPGSNIPDTRCENCSRPMRLCGPFWNGACYDKALIRRILGDLNGDGHKRIKGILMLMEQELDCPFYLELPHLAKRLKADCCKLRTLMNALANAGFDVSLVYYDNNSVKTNAPLGVVNEVLKEYVSKAKGKYNFENNEKVDQLYEGVYYKGKIMSGLKPLSLPKAL